MDDYKRYLAQQVLTEDQPVTYRSLSRALMVHVNTAKEMLYDFHKWQNDKRPGTLYATYLVYGTQRKPEETNGDVEMTESQSESGHVETYVPTSTLTLVNEEQLQEVLEHYEEVTSIHVYSLAPHPLKDLQLLAETASNVNKITLADDTSNSDNTYNAIVNPAVRKRDRKRAMPLPAPTTPLVKAEAKSQTKQEMKLEKNEEPKVGKVAPVKEAKPSVVAAAKKGAAAPNLKRQGSSGISQMFAKAAAKPKKPASMTGSATPTDTNTPSPALSDDGEDDSDMPDVKPTPIARKARKSRQDDLRQMMEESDEEIESKPETPPEEPVEEEEELPAEPEPKADEGPAEEVVSSGDGRKRGRRRVAKKVTKMDDQGYLITIQEQAWESFSEDESPPATKQKIEKAEKQAPAAKAKKGAAKAQGNIMSFFSKK